LASSNFQPFTSLPVAWQREVPQLGWMIVAEI
jgi:hypothetical protein